MRVMLLCVVLLIAAASSFAQTETGEARRSPFAVVDRAFQLRASMNGGELAAYIGEAATAEIKSASGLLMTAELMKQAGDYRADKFYQMAIAADAAEPAYELFYADYLRNIRGPLRPLFEEAERHYLSAIEKLRRQAESTAWAARVRGRVERGLVELYEEDGIPLAWRRVAPDLLAPVLFFSPALRAASSTADLDEVSDARDFTAEALYSASASRLGRPLTFDELRGLVRRKHPLEATNRLRLRIDGSTLDVAYMQRQVSNAQVTNFFLPDHFNGVEIRAIGITATQVFALPPLCDAAVKVGWQEQYRHGLVEFLPDALERVSQTQGELTLSRFFGSDKMDFTLAYVSQDIAPQVPELSRRDRQIASARFEYELLRPLTRMENPYRDLFGTRGWHFYGGVVDDREHFGAVVVKKRDYLLGTSLRGIGRFDVTLQPTLFTVAIGEAKSQSTTQLGAEATVLYRIVDEEELEGIPASSFLGLHLAHLHLVGSLRHDSARDGLTVFENDKLGLGLEAKLFVRGFADPASPGVLRFHGTTFLATLNVAREHFPILRKEVSALDWHVSAGF